MLNASFRGVRLIPKASANSRSRTGMPGANLPIKMNSRRYSAASDASDCLGFSSTTLRRSFVQWVSVITYPLAELADQVDATDQISGF